MAESVTVENVHPNTTVALRMKGISGETGSLKLYSYETDGSLKEVPAELWHIQTEAGETPDTYLTIYYTKFTLPYRIMKRLIFAKRKKKLKSQLYLETHKQNLLSGVSQML